MLDLARAIVADGRVSTLEARIFRAWLERHPELKGIEPVDLLVAEMGRIFADGDVTAAERDHLRVLLERITGTA